MRFLLYNIRYGTGLGRKQLPWSGYLGGTSKRLKRITDFIREEDPDVVGLLEVDSGSYRTGRKNQAETIAEDLGHHHTYAGKYAETARWTHRIPVLNKQGNAFIARDARRKESFHYFNMGMKRLVMELEFEQVDFFLVHLALGYRVRQNQLKELYSIIKNANKPVVVAGDFNLLWGEHEIELFLGATGLVNPNREGSPTFPSWRPKRHLDFILHSPDIKSVDFRVPEVPWSDHLPMVMDFEL